VAEKVSKETRPGKGTKGNEERRERARKKNVE
jgi:hypothetical protein